MCHNAPWLSVLDKQMRLQFAPKESKAKQMNEFIQHFIINPLSPNYSDNDDPIFNTSQSSFRFLGS